MKTQEKSMIERVVSALASTGKAWLDGKPEKGWADIPDEVMARAAIEAMREPTPEMIVAGNDKIDECIDFWNYDSGSGYAVEVTAAFSCINAMIDAALNPPAST